MKAGQRGGIQTGKYFGTDGFRGRAGVTIDSRQAFEVGRFLGWYYLSRRGGCRVVIGKDTRLSSYTLEYALAAGITASGGDAYIMHVTTTPSVAFVTRCEGFDCGVMISASHNPYEDNGIKLLNGAGEKLESGVLELIERYLDGEFAVCGRTSLPFACGEKIGRTVDYVAGRNRYTGHLISLSANSYKGLKIGLDCANGAGYKIARNVFEALGATLCMLGDKPDGLNVNEGCGATDTGALCRAVREHGLDVGFAFDGDADRCICVDERGQVIDGDGILYAAACTLKDRGELLADRVVATVMSNGGLKSCLSERQIQVITCPVGDSRVREKMAECGAVLGGEQSGHIIFGKLENTGDGIVTAIMLAEIMADRGIRASELVRGFTKLPQQLVNVRVRDREKSLSDVRVAAAVRAAKDILGPRGRLIVRASGTESVIRVLAEAQSDEECVQAAAIVARAIENVDGEGICAE